MDAQMIENKESKPTTTENHKGIKQEGGGSGVQNGGHMVDTPKADPCQCMANPTTIS